jgi:hypothetical protein
MTNETEDTLFETAWKTREAINSALHSGEVEKARELSEQLEAIQGRIKAREADHEASMEALRAFHRQQVAAGTTPATNEEAERVILKCTPYTGARKGTLADLAEDDIVDLTDMPHSYPEDDDIPEEQTARSHGALS